MGGLARVTALDASVLLACLDPEDPHHADGLRVLAGGRHPFVIHEITVAECLVRATRVGAEGSVGALVAAWGEVVGSHGSDGAVRLASMRVRTGLRMPDCCVLDAAEQYKTDVASFDRRLRAAAIAVEIDVLGGGGTANPSPA
jgi:predicted nucleic acid-binding protein